MVLKGGQCPQDKRDSPALFWKKENKAKKTSASGQGPRENRMERAVPTR